MYDSVHRRDVKEMKIADTGHFVITADDYWKLVKAHNRLVDRVEALENGEPND